MPSKKTVFLTGASGNMGRATLEALLQRSDDFDIRALVLPSEQDRKRMAPYLGRPGLKVLWGDLTRYDDVVAGVSGADYVLHLGAMVSPLADYHPQLTTRVNVGSARNLVRAIKSQRDPDRVHLVYIGTVAQTGSRMAPIHWGRTGDPIKLSHFDHYAVTKTQAEGIIAESGLKHWVSLRQTGIAHADLWRVFDPIIFHSPLNGVFEWVTVRDSARLMVNLCQDTVPATLWQRFYNIGGGESCRLVNHENMVGMFGAMGLRDYRQILRPQWFALQNFHGQWYEDSDELERLVPFRSESMKDFHAELARSIPLPVKLGTRFFPGAVRGRIEKLARGPGGTLHWMAHDEQAEISAYFGSRAAWQAIPDWDRYELQQPPQNTQRLNHGYDESKPLQALRLADVHEAAAFRGGTCRSADMHTGDLSTPLDWRCGRGHEFSMSPRLVLLGGHWCPHCMLDTAGYPELARQSPFFAQVWSDSEGLTAQEPAPARPSRVKRKA